ncbi:MULTISPECIES: carboxypeptidase regulatory-like domain-containing protein [unclassified Microcoleus]|uniref:carboxypeptidase regulatory-like domain-containing protein n=1 Tax=unclassified Microcoleus TaxID=2642155 RepID=UPI002FD3533A
MSAKEQTKNRVAIAGQVIDAKTNLAIAGALVEVGQKQGKFKNWLDLHALQYAKSWEKMVERPDRTLTAIDGCFSFINLPDGEYTDLTIQISAQGYKPVDRSVKLSQSRIMELQNFELNPEDKPKVEQPS